MKRMLQKFNPFLSRMKNSAADDDKVDAQARTIPYFSKIPEPALGNLIERTKILNYVKKVDFNQDYFKNNAYFVLFLGNVTLITPYDGNHNSRSANLQVQEPSLGYGKALLITDEVSEYYGITLEKSLFGFIPKNEFFSWMKTYPDVKFSLLNIFDAQASGSSSSN